MSALQIVARLGAEHGKVVGAGTIIAPEQIRVARLAGAQFLVSPGLDDQVVLSAQRAVLPLLPGVATATEVQRATSLELRWLKAFPAQWLGAAWFAHMKGPFPDVQFVATGGMTADNGADFLFAGARVVALGSALDLPDQLDRIAALARAES